MCQFIETMLVMGGEIVNLSYHNRRMNDTLTHLRGEKGEDVDINRIIRPEIDKLLMSNPCMNIDNYKARIQYGTDEIVSVTLTPYSMREVRSLKCVYRNDIDYKYKSIDRQKLNDAFSERGECDDALIIRNGLVTDTTIANVALWNGKEWITPANPLLKGTRRASLIDKRLLREDDIRVDDLFRFQKIRIFNALIDWGKIEIQNINQLIV